MKRKKYIHKGHKIAAKKRNVFILSRWLAVVSIIVIVYLLIITGGKISSIAGLFMKPTPTPMSDSGNNILPPVFSDNEYVDMAVSDLSKLKKVNPDRISIKEVVKRDWENSSLGCPRPGKFYAQMITPGFLIVLVYNNSDYFYHAGLNKVVLCQNG